MVERLGMMPPPTEPEGGMSKSWRAIASGLRRSSSVNTVKACASWEGLDHRQLCGPQLLSSLTPAGTPQKLYPHCLGCSRTQGGQANAAKNRSQ